VLIERLRRTGFPAFAGNDSGEEERARSTPQHRSVYNNTASAAATDSALSVTVRSRAPACTLMFSAKKRASET